MPLPPYIASRRAPDEQDRADYQTLFAHDGGLGRGAHRRACISPTTLMARLNARGIALHKVTLHVGAGTFLPVKAEDTAGHRMHAEFGSVTAEVADGAQRGARATAGASWRSARPRCGCWKARPARTALIGRSPARPRSSSRPATDSARST